MHTDEHNTIRYLMKEMDPSEEAEFERKMREDEDLLIEVESLRATKRKLSSLPQKKPPKEITNQVLNDIKQLQSNKSTFLKTFSTFAKRGLAAAILLMSMTVGYFYFMGNSATTQETAIPSDSETVEPWVDRNEVLRFTGGEQSSVQSEFTRSYEKLQLVNDPSANGSANNSILLTGSSN
ncbi:hypothetical protein [Gracilimonas sp.]|uniref:hypothetical protein n=1 Tax=Gracilimonas sp. TaxID=1974203 RepID=UPI0028726118|nr:hypothetical protein [Gracilimonas sp.]